DRSGLGARLIQQEEETLGTYPLAADSRQNVSAITVTYHTGPVLWPCIDSILAQSELLELIVIVNGADQTIRANLQHRAEKDQRIRIVEPATNLGFAPACNLGAKIARGDHL